MSPVMQLRAIVAMVLGPFLATCQVGPVSGGTAAPTQKPAWNSFSPKASGECVKTPMMPTTFFFKRKWASFFNIIELHDRFGREIGFVQTWLFNWKDPFGYPGATFYLKKEPRQPKPGVWGIHPHRGADGWDSKGVQRTREQEYLSQQGQYNRQEDKGFLENLKEKVFGSLLGESSNRLSATMEGKIGFLNSDVTVKNCHGKNIAHAYRMTAPQRWYNKVFKKNRDNYLDDYGKIYTYIPAGGREVGDGRYFTKEHATGNVLKIDDKGQPPVPVAEIVMREACNPFPPFCAKMGIYGWFWYGSAWEGRIVQPGYNQSLASGFMQVQQTAGTGTDMRFLALYSAFQFSNTRFAPLFGLVLNLLFVSCCSCLVWSCFATAPPPAPRESEETTKLIETEAPAEPALPNNASPWNCCTRRGGRTVAIGD